MLNKINKLKKGDTIGIINPAFPNPQNREYKEMFEVFEKYGFKVKLGKSLNAFFFCFHLFFPFLVVYS